MYDKERFARAVYKSGLKKRYISRQLGLAYDTFLKKSNGVVEWKISEALKVSKVLGITKAERDSIFFAQEVHNM